MQTLTLPALTVPDHITETKLGVLRIPGVTIPERMIVIDPVLFQEMIRLARLATESAYNNFPSVKFPVGAAVVMADDASGEIFTAANCENGVLNAGICAERALLHYVVAKGFRRIKYLVVTTPSRASEDISGRSPCGLCRQTIAEFADDKTLILLDHQAPGVLGDILDMARLLPYGYRLQGL